MLKQLEILTPREKELLHLVRQGLDNKGIGMQLNITHRTVKNHMTNIYRKYGVQAGNGRHSRNLLFAIWIRELEERIINA